MGSVLKRRCSDCTWVTYVVRRRISTSESDLRRRGEENLLATTVWMDQNFSQHKLTLTSAFRVQYYNKIKAR